ncbi:flagellar basal body rod protein FlgB [Buchnera aphidicola (Chaitoregma tattakana)]|uniref:flagellar basal body rod protein FlgB n=1 Tax=Buchnera aphidicola TaxID=9 RepID=UPI0031B80F4B
MLNNINDFFEFNKIILNSRIFKQESIASNIANSETPNYNRKDIDFKDLLNNTILSNRKNDLTITCNSHIKKKNKYFNINNYIKILEKKNKFKKNKSVNINEEKIKFLKNSLEYEIDIALINNKIKNIYLAIQG